MKIIYVHQYFKTPEEGGAIRSWYIASAMVQAGHTVDMITTSNQPKEIIQSINGIRVHYLRVAYKNSFGFIRRLWSFIKFTNMAVRYISTLNKFNIAYITSTPLTVGLIALRLKKKFDLPYIFEVRDLWPEAPIEAGILRSRILKKIARYLESRTYNNAEKLIALSPGIADSFANKNIELPIHICTNISDCNFFRLENSKNETLKKLYKIEDEFVIGYFGAIGKLNALEYLLKAAKYFQEQKAKVRFLIIGNGGQKEFLIRNALKENIQNVEFIRHLNKNELREHLSLVDAAYISFASLKVLESNSPNKFFDALASGKLIILNISGWLRDHVEKNKCGFYADPENPSQFLTDLYPFLMTTSLLKEYQSNSRALAEKEFERTKLTSELLSFIQS